MAGLARSRAFIVLCAVAVGIISAVVWVGRTSRESTTTGVANLRVAPRGERAGTASPGTPASAGQTPREGIQSTTRPGSLGMEPDASALKSLLNKPVVTVTIPAQVSPVPAVGLAGDAVGILSTSKGPHLVVELAEVVGVERRRDFPAEVPKCSIENVTGGVHGELRLLPIGEVNVVVDGELGVWGVEMRARFEYEIAGLLSARSETEAVVVVDYDGKRSTRRLQVLSPIQAVSVEDGSIVAGRLVIRLQVSGLRGIESVLVDPCSRSAVRAVVVERIVAERVGALDGKVEALDVQSNRGIDLERGWIVVSLRFEPNSEAVEPDVSQVRLTVCLTSGCRVACEWPGREPRNE